MSYFPRYAYDIWCVRMLICVCVHTHIMCACVCMCACLIFSLWQHSTYPLFLVGEKWIDHLCVVKCFACIRVPSWNKEKHSVCPKMHVYVICLVGYIFVSVRLSVSSPARTHIEPISVNARHKAKYFASMIHWKEEHFRLVWSNILLK